MAAKNREPARVRCGERFINILRFGVIGGSGVIKYSRGIPCLVESVRYSGRGALIICNAQA